MAQQYDNTNTFTLFKNDKGDNPKRPDYTGLANVDGIEFRQNRAKQQREGRLFKRLNKEVSGSHT